MAGRNFSRLKSTTPILATGCPKLRDGQEPGDCAVKHWRELVQHRGCQQKTNQPESWLVLTSRVGDDYASANLRRKISKHSRLAPSNNTVDAVSGTDWVVYEKDKEEKV